MPIFHYQAFDATGALHKGTQDAANESEVRQLLRSKDLFPKEIRTSRFTRKSNKAKSSEGFKLPEFAKRRNYAKSLMLFTRQLEVLLDATIPYDKASSLSSPRPRIIPSRASSLRSAGACWKGRRWQIRWKNTPRLFLRCTSAWSAPEKTAATSA